MPRIFPIRRGGPNQMRRLTQVLVRVGAINCKLLLVANTRSINWFIDSHSYQYLQKRLSRFGIAEGGMGLMAKPYQTQKAGAALAQIRGHAALELLGTILFKRR